MDSQEQFGCYIVMRYDGAQEKALKMYLADDDNLEEHHGRVEACTSKVHNIEGEKWNQFKGLGAIYFRDRQNARVWFSNFRCKCKVGKIDAFVIDLIAFPPEKHSAVSLAILDLHDEHRFFTQYCPQFGPPFRDAGGQVGASRDVVTKSWEILSGSWIPEGRVVLLNYLPNVEAALEFFFLDGYKEAQDSRRAYSEVDIFVFERRTQ